MKRADQDSLADGPRLARNSLALYREKANAFEKTMERLHARCCGCGNECNELCEKASSSPPDWKAAATEALASLFAAARKAAADQGVRGFAEGSEILEIMRNRWEERKLHSKAVCPVCLDREIDVFLPCGHFVCTHCREGLRRSGTELERTRGEFHCPTCRAAVLVSQTSPAYLP